MDNLPIEPPNEVDDFQVYLHGCFKLSYLSHFLEFQSSAFPDILSAALDESGITDGDLENLNFDTQSTSDYGSFQSHVSSNPNNVINCYGSINFFIIYYIVIVILYILFLFQSSLDSPDEVNRNVNSSTTGEVNHADLFTQALKQLAHTNRTNVSSTPVSFLQLQLFQMFCQKQL